MLQNQHYRTKNNLACVCREVKLRVVGLLTRCVCVWRWESLCTVLRPTQVTWIRVGACVSSSARSLDWTGEDGEESE